LLRGGNGGGFKSLRGGNGGGAESSGSRNDGNDCLRGSKGGDAANFSDGPLRSDFHFKIDFANMPMEICPEGSS
jgi:hypothetical protein